MSVDGSVSECISSYEFRTEPLEKTIEPFRRYVGICHTSHHPIESDEDGDLDNHHKTPLEGAFPIGLEDLHRLLGKSLRIILVFLLDLIELRLKRAHTFLHIVASQCLFDQQQPDRKRQQNDGDTEIASEYSQEYSKDIEYRTIQNLCKQHSQHNKILYNKISGYKIRKLQV